MSRNVPCPGCGSAKFYFIQTVRNWHTIESIEGASIDTLNFVDEVPTEDYRLFCKDCEWEGNTEDYQKKVEEKYKDE